jgi:membrane-bound inhibitor of C-type lysozyme
VVSQSSLCYYIRMKNIFSKSRRSVLITIIFALLILVGIYAGWFKGDPRIEGISAVFNCAEGKTIAATFYNGADARVELKLGDRRELSLPQAISASGARYASADEAIVFWNKGDTAFITEAGQTTFTDCVVTP